MRKLLTFLALTISFNMNAQISTYDTDNSGFAASAIGFATTAMGLYSIASGDYSVAIGYGALEQVIAKINE